jgi:very-short-patch-repair endonuclease
VRDELRDMFDREIVLSRRAHPEWSRSLSQAATRGEIVALLPGVYTSPAMATNWRALALAASLWDPNAVVTGDAAAALSFWPELTPTTVVVAGRHTVMRRPGLTFVQRRLPAEFVQVRAGVRMTAPDLTAIDLSGTRGGEAIDRALRGRAVTLDRMRAALDLTPRRRGNRDRRAVLLDSRDEPWSAAERLAHQLFRKAGITDWRANVPFEFEGRRYYLDIAFRHKPLVIEIDGRIHLDSHVFESDRVRGNDLVLARKATLHFTWSMLATRPETVIDTTVRALDLW